MDMGDFLTSFDEGDLETDDIGRGMHLCFRNAEALIDDARSLREDRPGRSMSLAILALEEIGKIFLLSNAAAASANGPVSWKSIQKDLSLKSHRAKQTAFSAYGSNVLDKFGSSESTRYYETQIPGGLIPLLDRFKQLGFYVDSFKGDFISPEEFGEANEEWADLLIAAASERLESIRSLHDSEESSLETARGSAWIAKKLVGKSEEEVQDVLREWLSKTPEDLANEISKGDAR